MDSIETSTEQDKSKEAEERLLRIIREEFPQPTTRELFFEKIVYILRLMLASGFLMLLCPLIALTATGKFVSSFKMVCMAIEQQEYAAIIYILIFNLFGVVALLIAVIEIIRLVFWLTKQQNINKA